MKSYFFYTDQLTVGYDGKPLIKEINIQLNKRRNPDTDRSQRCRKIYYFEEYHKTAFPDQRNGISGTGTDEPDDQQGSVKKNWL